MPTKNIVPLDNVYLRDIERRVGSQTILVSDGRSLITEIYRLRSIIKKLNNGKTYDAILIEHAKREHQWHEKYMKLLNDRQSPENKIELRNKVAHILYETNRKIRDLLTP